LAGEYQALVIPCLILGKNFRGRFNHWKFSQLLRFLLNLKRRGVLKYKIPIKNFLLLER
jgi:hypothetical protein